MKGITVTVVTVLYMLAALAVAGEGMAQVHTVKARLAKAEAAYQVWN